VFSAVQVNGHCWVTPAILKPMQEADQAFADVDKKKRMPADRRQR
jgi:hypothetical protein